MNTYDYGGAQFLATMITWVNDSERESKNRLYESSVHNTLKREKINIVQLAVFVKLPYFFIN